MDTIIAAPWIIPVRADDHESTPTVLTDHALVINDQGVIIDIVPQTTARQQYDQATVTQLDHHIITPGLINTHTHAAMSLFRGMADDLPLMEWLNNHIWPAEGQWVSPDFVKAGTELAAAEMIRSGTTCMADMYFFPEEVAKVALAAQMRVSLSCPVLDFSTPWAQHPAEYFSKASAVHKQFQGESLVRVGIGPHAPYTVSDEPLTQCLRFAEQHDQAHIQIHLHETAQEVSDALKKDQMRPVQRLDTLGFFSSSSSRVSAVHMTALDQTDIDTIAKRSASVIHCPESNLKLASGFCPIQALHEANILTALGTDGAASNNDLDMIGELRCAAILAKAVSQNAAAVPAYRALRMATLNGAIALGMDEFTGSLEVGKQADLIAVDIRSPHSLPMYNPISQMAYCIGREQVSHVWVAGRPLLTNQQLTTLDMDAILDNAMEWGRKIAQNGSS